jgi:hypothetical protein
MILGTRRSSQSLAGVHNVEKQKGEAEASFGPLLVRSSVETDAKRSDNFRFADNSGMKPRNVRPRPVYGP